MTVGGGSIPASTLWWDGWTVAKNISDEEAEATFIAMMNGIRPDMMQDQKLYSSSLVTKAMNQLCYWSFESAKMSTTPYLCYRTWVFYMVHLETR